MILLDENFPRQARHQLLSWRISARQIGYELAYRGILDEQIFPLLHRLRSPTLFTLDLRLYRRDRCHSGYCIVCLDVADERAATFVKLTLRHPAVKTRAARMGKVVRASDASLRYWQSKSALEHTLRWVH